MVGNKILLTVDRKWFATVKVCGTDHIGYTKVLVVEWIDDIYLILEQGKGKYWNAYRVIDEG